MENTAVGLMLVLLMLISVGPATSETMRVLTCVFAYGESCDELSYYLWTRNNRNESQQVTSSTLLDSNFDPSLPTKMIIHGYASGVNLSQLVAIREAYLTQGDYNIIMVDYLNLTDSPCYPAAARNVRYAGKCVARFIAEAAGSGWLSQGRARLHVIGFSLGAQTAGFVARHLKPWYTLSRITGLDPALPLFVTDDPNKKLTAADAVLVDVIHSNSYLQGKAERCGSADFYMNGGTLQPGCPRLNVFGMLQCDHHRAATYFAESIRSTEGFWGWQCPSIEDYEMGLCPAEGEAALMGEWWDPKDRGAFFVVTNSEAPFAKGIWWRTD